MKALATALLSFFALTGFGQFDRVECLSDKQQLPIFKVLTEYPDKSQGYASAVVLRKGYAITAGHAVDGSPVSIVMDVNSEPRTASVVALDPINDIALLAVDTQGIEPLWLFKGKLEANREVWVAGYPGEAGTSFSGPILSIVGGHLKIGAPVFPGMSGGAVIVCDKGIPYLAGTITSFNYRLVRSWTQITPERKEIYERILNDGTSNAPGGMMLVWFTEYAVEMREKKKRE